MNLRNLGLAAGAELILLVILAGTTLMEVTQKVRIPVIQVVSITQPGSKSKAVSPTPEPAKSKTTAAVKPSPNPGKAVASNKGGQSGDTTGTRPASFPGDRANPVPQSLLDVIYPKAAENEEWEGVVVVEAAIDASGHPTTVKIAKSSGHEVLDNAFMASVMKMRFKPKRVQGVDVPGTVTLQHRFQLDN